MIKLIRDERWRFCLSTLIRRGLASSRELSSYQERISKVKDAWSKTRESSTEELGKNISASRRAEILLLAQTYLNFDANEQNYMNYLSLQQGLRKGKSLLELQTDFESVEKGEDGQWIPIYPNYFIQQERINELWPMGANTCLLYTSDAADDLLCVDLGGRRIIKKKNILST
eukprot:TRINITY_DN6073_c0_g1_i8.p1 TRINITY_DN6073_c0_g1~~TRINITY_DN6073_c0_g1_i8.p1  ORF type:complete len:172 (-),score=28.03 TRINITY_DN6073_c0_g1_i8:1-516(-)